MIAKDNLSSVVFFLKWNDISLITHYSNDITSYALTTFHYAYNVIDSPTAMGNPLPVFTLSVKSLGFCSITGNVL